jgi:RNA polymerase sigma factor (sigma-70 family)
MADHFLADALASVRRTLALAAEPTDDARLLARFAHDRDEAAFAELVARHGPAVWAACRRGAKNAADAEDAFQATFLVLARRAGRVRRAASVGGWLFRVAVRVTARTRTRAARPAVTDRPLADPAPDPADRAAWRDLVAVLDAEMADLPDSVRAALVSCYYEGLTQDEAARRLGWKVRTIRARVARGRKLLRTRLARRGVDLGAALAAAAVGMEAPAVMPKVSLTPAAGSAMSPAISDLVAHGMAATSRSARLSVAVALVAAAVVATGYVIGTTFGPAGGEGGEAALRVDRPAGVSQPPDQPRAAIDAVAVYHRAVDGCVYIVSESNGGAIEGTGTLIDREKRLVLTTSRVVGDSDVVSVQFPYHNLDGTIETDRKDYARSAAAKLTPMGRVIRRDKTRDLALVQLDRLGRDARPLELAEAGVPATVLHIGSGTGNLFPMTVRRIVQTDAPAVIARETGTGEPFKAATITLSGTTDDSGGPLIDRDGRLAGVVVGAATGPADGSVTLAVGIAEVRVFLADKDKEIPAPPAVPVTGNQNLPDHVGPTDFGPTDFGPLLEPIPKDFDAAALYEKCVKSTVFIVTPLKRGAVSGSGSLIDLDKKLVVTNYHVVDEADFVFVQFPQYTKSGQMITSPKTYMDNIPLGQAIKGKVLHRDRSRDLALVELEKVPAGTPAIPLAKKTPRLGTTVWNIGRPGGVEQLFGITQGNVRAVGVEVHQVDGHGPDSAFRVRARILTMSNPIALGDSGGPGIDRRGYLVGVAESGITGGGTQNVNRCIDVTEVRAFLTEKKIVIKDLTDEKDEPKSDPKSGDTPPTKKDGTESPKPDRPPGGGAAPPPSPQDEKAAASALSRAKLFAEGEENRATYTAKLRDVIAKYPGTAAAKEAANLLDAKK